MHFLKRSFSLNRHSYFQFISFQKFDFPQQLRTYCEATKDVLIKDVGNNNKLVELNRPRVLNALNLPMIRKLTPLYKEWQSNPDLVVIMKGVGDKAFCAGGDIRAIYEAGKSGEGTLPQDFFKEEYILNYLISKKSFSHVAILNGITMGGGVGLSVHGKYRVATEKTVFSMPETGIGFFCDVGGSYFLPRLEWNQGIYLGLTGDILKGRDVFESGVATHFVKEEHLDELTTRLSKATSSEVEEILNEFHQKKPREYVYRLKPFRDVIEQAFSLSHMEDIMNFLYKYKGTEEREEFAKNTARGLSKRSPTSLKVVLRQLREGKNLPYNRCFEMEYRISQAFMRHPHTDFFEGVRATLVTKDKKPKWNPPLFEYVYDSEVDKYFRGVENPLDLSGL